MPINLTVNLFNVCFHFLKFILIFLWYVPFWLLEQDAVALHGGLTNDVSKR